MSPLQLALTSSVGRVSSLALHATPTLLRNHGSKKKAVVETSNTRAIHAFAPLPERGDNTVRPKALVSIAKLDSLLTRTSMGHGCPCQYRGRGRYVGRACDSVDHAVDALVLAPSTRLLPSIADIL